MRLKHLLLALTCVMTLSACNKADPQQNTAQQQKSNETTQTFDSKAGEITLPVDLQRIAVLDTNALSTIQALGASDKVVAVTRSTPLPNALQAFSNEKYADVGTAKEPNLERVLATQPQLIVMGARMEKMLDQLKQIAPTYFNEVDNADFFNSFKQQTLTIAKMVDKTPEAEQQLQQLDQDIAALKEKTKGKTALMILVNNNKFSAYGPGSRFGMIYDLYGFTPIDSEIKVGLHGMSVSHEFIAEKDPDYLFVMDRGAAISNKTDGAQQALNNRIIQNTKAAKNGHIIYLNAGNWYLTTTGLGGQQAMLKEVADTVQ